MLNQVQEELVYAGFMTFVGALLPIVGILVTSWQKEPDNLHYAVFVFFPSCCIGVSLIVNYLCNYIGILQKPEVTLARKIHKIIGCILVQLFLISTFVDVVNRDGFSIVATTLWLIATVWCGYQTGKECVYVSKNRL